MKNLINFIFFRWSKWEVYIPNITETVGLFPEKKVVVDIYVKTNIYTGLKKYKRVVKYRIRPE